MTSSDFAYFIAGAAVGFLLAFYGLKLIFRSTLYMWLDRQNRE
jgi:hypothetical protein